MPAGGYQKPSSPAPVSGPGRMSKRTDGQPIRDPGGLPYGDNQELRSQQAAAPMSGASPEAMAAQQGGIGGIPLANLAPSLFDPTDRPDEPLTAGASFGPGPGPEALSTPSAGNGPTQARLTAYMPVYIQMAESPYTSPEFKAMTNYIRQVLGG